MEFTIMQGNTRPDIEADLSASIAGATCRFLMSNLDGTVVIDQPVTVLDAALGLVKYSFSALDTADPGIFRAHWKVTFSDGKIETYPNVDDPGATPVWVEITSTYG